jgi:hypothetical protein
MSLVGDGLCLFPGIRQKWGLYKENVIMVPSRRTVRCEENLPFVDHLRKETIGFPHLCLFAQAFAFCAPLMQIPVGQRNEQRFADVHA